MKTSLGSTAAATAVILMSMTVAAGAPDVGDEAPGFELPGTDGKTYDLTSFAGKRAVVIAWYPKAFTGG